MPMRWTIWRHKNPDDFAFAGWCVGTLPRKRADAFMSVEVVPAADLEYSQRLQGELTEAAQGKIADLQATLGRVLSRVSETFEKHDAWRGGNVQSIEDLAERVERAERALRRIADAEMMRLAPEIARVALEKNADLTGNY